MQAPGPGNSEVSRLRSSCLREHGTFSCFVQSGQPSGACRLEVMLDSNLTQLFSPLLALERAPITATRGKPPWTPGCQTQEGWPGAIHSE